MRSAAGIRYRHAMKTLLIGTLMALVGFAAGWRLAEARKQPILVVVHSPASASKPAAEPAASRPAAPDNRPAAGPGPSAPDAAGMALADAIDRLTSPQASYRERQALLEQLRKLGRIGDVIAALKQLASGSPNDPSVPLALGEAEIAEQRTVSENGGSFNELALLAIQADQNFGAALSLDPTNWAAQYEKAAALSHWPAAMNKGPEIIQSLTSLVTQQEAGTPQPEYAQTYLLLGQQYLKAGQASQAQQVWQQGLSQFPLNGALQQAVSHASNP
jgi:hypothetical protein